MGINHLSDLVRDKGESTVPMKKKLGVASVCLLLVSLLIVTAPQPVRSAQFVLASWDYPDEYGQGILGVIVYENSTGAWVFLENVGYDESSTVEVNDSLALKIVPFFVINHTFHELTDIAEAKAIIRGSIEMTLLGETLFSQTNMTYSDTGDVGATCWWLSYYVIAPIILLSGQIYTVTVTYEIYSDEG